MVEEGQFDGGNWKCASLAVERGKFDGGKGKFGSGKGQVRRWKRTT